MNAYTTDLAAYAERPGDLRKDWFCFGCDGPMPAILAYCPSCEEETQAYRWWGNERGAVRFTVMIDHCVCDAEELVG